MSIYCVCSRDDVFLWCVVGQAEAGFTNWFFFANYEPFAVPSNTLPINHTRAKCAVVFHARRFAYGKCVFGVVHEN